MALVNQLQKFSRSILGIASNYSKYTSNTTLPFLQATRGISTTQPLSEKQESRLGCQIVMSKELDGIERYVLTLCHTKTLWTIAHPQNTMPRPMKTDVTIAGVTPITSQRKDIASRLSDANAATHLSPHQR
ncbi:uncharacterized protein LOC117240677 isoform X2 [Bombus vosnesenskii]|uniref:Uncharacterized protein LOC117240677 isoform X2 n=1 Tax=Bombus vosnesenskii TaxID=207650 RepID=A0A6J3LD31_9HYME|nr:uncharacterized protein LOC117240677 isoform X2 [Bombus vosnesenskii]